eukprot:354646-Chlamydomonas_euryale.AAC.1
MPEHHHLNTHTHTPPSRTLPLPHTPRFDTSGANVGGRAVPRAAARPVKSGRVKRGPAGDAADGAVSRGEQHAAGAATELSHYCTHLCATRELGADAAMAIERSPLQIKVEAVVCHVVTSARCTRARVTGPRSLAPRSRV